MCFFGGKGTISKGDYKSLLLNGPMSVPAVQFGLETVNQTMSEQPEQQSLGLGE